MRFVTYRSPSVGAERVGLVEDGTVLGYREPASLVDILSSDPDGLSRAAQAIVLSPLETVAESDVKLLAPIPVPPSVRDFMSFEAHVVESMAAIGREVSPFWYEAPAFYFQNPAAIRAPGDTVEISPGSKAFDYELEFAAVIGRPGADLSVDQAGGHIAGYMLLCDWSARDLQESEMSVGLGPVKSKDSATTIGPYFVTPDELVDVREGKGFRLAMEASVNGRPYSAGSAADLYWSFEQMISYASRGTTLVPGDIIGSGTVGTGCILELARVKGADAYPWLSAGDRVVASVERLGRIDVEIRPARAAQPLS
jgi:2-keto-4-pentenoate hydratase/2-oxohepta-3-ene-1,7-dioic acid hydratase in catechol pathway